MLDFGSLDWIFIVIILGTTLMGVFSGLIQQIASAIGIIGGIVTAQLLCESMAQFLSRWIADANLARAISYLSIFIVVGLLVRLLAKLITAIVEKLALKTVNRCAGALFGLLKGFVITAVIAGTLHFYHSPSTDQMVENSKIIPYYNSFYRWLDDTIGDDKLNRASQTMRKKIGLEVDEKD